VHCVSQWPATQADASQTGHTDVALCRTRAASVKLKLCHGDKWAGDHEKIVLQYYVTLDNFRKLNQNQKLEYWMNLTIFFSLIPSWSLAKGVPRTIITFCGIVLVGLRWPHLSSRSSKMTSFKVSLKTMDGTCDMVEWPMTPRSQVGPKLPPVNKRVNRFSGKYVISFHKLNFMIFIGKKCSI
jgi:hypothetical protein